MTTVQAGSDLSPQKRLRQWALGGPWVLLLALAAFGFFFRARLEPVVAGMVYWFLWGTFVLLGAAICECGVRKAECGERKGESGERSGDWRLEVGNGSAWHVLRPWGVALVTGLLLTSICFLSVEPAFRVLSDETNQVDASLSLYLDRTLKLVTQGTYSYGSFHPTMSAAMHRGGLYPFCICLLHSLFGYNGYHGFVVNFIASVLTLAVVIRFGQKVLGLTYGLIAAVLLVSFPLYSLVMTSSAFEGLNALMIALVLYQLHRFLEKPNGPQLEVLLLLTVLASQCRYETVLLALPVAVAGYWKRRELAGARLSWRLAVIPLSFLPVVWQRIAMGGKGLGTVAGDKAFFSPKTEVDST